jgi:putative membrane protein
MYRTLHPVGVVGPCYLAGVPPTEGSRDADPHAARRVPAPPRPVAVGLLGALWRGSVMGAADVVPGVSGGTMALILGVYERLLTALAALTRPPLWTALRRRDWGMAWRSFDGTFLLGLVTGIAFSVIMMAGLIESALETYRPHVYALFFGLIAASIAVVGLEVRRWRAVEVVALVAAAVAATALVGLTPVSTPSTTPFLVLTGAIGICALILPGVSGAFLLVLLGQYETVLGAIARGDLQVLAPFALGAAVGLLAFARLLGGWLRRFPDPTHAALAGFLLGSLRRVWPWQPEGVLQLTPLAPPDLGAAAAGLLLALVGFTAVLAVHRAGRPRRG